MQLQRWANTVQPVCPVGAEPSSKRPRFPETGTEAHRRQRHPTGEGSAEERTSANRGRARRSRAGCEHCWSRGVEGRTVSWGFLTTELITFLDYN